MKISKLVSRIPGSATLALTAKVNALKAQGKDVVGFTAGEPDFDTPENIKDSAIQALQQGKTKYTPVGGTPELKEAISANVNQDYGLNVSPDNVIVSCGAKHSLYNLFLTLFEEGDEVICTGPYWVSYPPMIEMTGATLVIIDTRPGMKLHAEMVAGAITKRTKGIIINSPSNPTGMVFEQKELEKIAELCIRHDLVIVSDDIYRKIIFDDRKFFSMATISPEVAGRTFIVDGSSKTYAMTGWRIGYTAAPADLLAAMRKVHQFTIMSAPTTGQMAGVTALSDPGAEEAVHAMIASYDRRRQLIVKGLNEIGLDCFEPQGAFYAFPSVQKTGMSDEEFANGLLQEEHVAVVPGNAFGVGGDGYVRCSYATAYEKIEQALEKMHRFMQRHG